MSRLGSWVPCFVGTVGPSGAHRWGSATRQLAFVCLSACWGVRASEGTRATFNRRMAQTSEGCTRSAATAAVATPVPHSPVAKRGLRATRTKAPNQGHQSRAHIKAPAVVGAGRERVGRWATRSAPRHALGRAQAVGTRAIGGQAKARLAKVKHRVRHQGGAESQQGNAARTRANGNRRATPGHGDSFGQATPPGIKREQLCAWRSACVGRYPDWWGASTGLPKALGFSGPVADGCAQGAAPTYCCGGSAFEG